MLQLLQLILPARLQRSTEVLSGVAKFLVPLAPNQPPATLPTVIQEVEALTNKAMDGSIGLEKALEERLRIIDCSPADIRCFLQDNPPESRLVRTRVICILRF